MKNLACTFFFIGNSYKAKTLREDAQSRELKYVACATALGARVSQAKLFVRERFCR